MPPYGETAGNKFEDEGNDGHSSNDPLRLTVTMISSR